MTTDHVAAKPHRSTKMTAKAGSAHAHEPLRVTLKKSAAPTKELTEVLVVGAFADGTLSAAAQAIDAASKGKLSRLIERGDLDVKAGASVMLYDVDGTAAERVLLVSLGARYILLRNKISHD